MNYKFKDCTCHNLAGSEITIPDGIWSVAEFNTVAVYVDGNIIHDLSVPAFLLLKTQGKVILDND